MVLDIYCIFLSDLVFLNACPARFKVGLKDLSLVLSGLSNFGWGPWFSFNKGQSNTYVMTRAVYFDCSCTFDLSRAIFALIFIINDVVSTTCKRSYFWLNWGSESKTNVIYSLQGVSKIMQPDGWWCWRIIWEIKR